MAHTVCGIQLLYYSIPNTVCGILEFSKRRFPVVFKLGGPLDGLL